MHVQPISCFRPAPERAGRFSAPPYDIFDDEQARSYVCEHPDSFMAIDRPETAFDGSQDPMAPEVYAHAVKLLNDRVLDGTLLKEERPCIFAYRMKWGEFSQTGVIAAISVDDYLDGTVRRHEQVREEKVLDRKAHMEAVTAQVGPSIVVYPDFHAIDVLVGLACTAEPLYDFTDEDGVRHTVWRIARDLAVEAICETFKQVPHGYIADGHHRAEASARLALEARERGEEGPREAFLSLLFPASSMNILAYNRVVSDTNGLSEQEFLEALVQRGIEVGEPQDGAIEPDERASVGMYAFGAWRRLRFENVPDGEYDPTAALDVALLQDRVLSQVLGVIDPRTDSRISFVSGAEGCEALERLAGETGVAFCMFPTSMEEIMRVSDAGMLMPPKSTWFAPKPRSGLFLRRV